ncbi:glycoside hydrolase family 3 protein [Auricularia subglabra TFB-10046 SS5]|nr:glycoside hydrolase family 3 protein [Auricularia subglabra TFB-10046 SS5]
MRSLAAACYLVAAVLAAQPTAEPDLQAVAAASTAPSFDAAWDQAYKKARAKIAGWTLEEKVSVTTGTSGRCAGNLRAIEPKDGRGWPGLCMEDGPLAMRPGDLTTIFPAGVNTAATFNRELIRARAVALGREFVGKGVNVAFGPELNMIRAPTGGRNWETFGADPFLSGEAAYETVLGMQSAGVQACAKHYLNNEQEYARFSSSSDVDDRTQHQVYGHPFLRGVQAGLASVMCALQLVNGTHACGNSELINGLLRKDFGFKGFVVSDWYGTRSTMDAVNGLDITMPGVAAIPRIPLQQSIVSPPGTSYFGGNLTSAVQNGTIPQSAVDEMVARVVAAWYRLKQDSPSYPQVNYNSGNKTDPATNLHVDVRSDHAKTARVVAAASHVLLKNTRSALPLTKAGLKNGLLVAGSDARAGDAALYTARAGAMNDGVLVTGWGSGAGWLVNLTAPNDALAARAKVDGTVIEYALDDWNTDAAAAAARGKSAALVFVKTNSGEGHIVPPVEFDPNGINQGDRLNISAWNNGDKLILAVAAQNPNTVVVVHSVGPMNVEAWINHPNVTAVVWAGVVGQEVGNALVDVLYGDVNPSGRLPYTVAKRLEDYPAQVSYAGGINDNFPVPYSEGLLVDYRHFDAHNIAPRFEFGFGLSYTTFSYSALAYWPLIVLPSPELLAWRSGRGVAPTSAQWLHKPLYAVTFILKNTGKKSGIEIAQLYLHHPASSGEPPSVLKGFEAVDLKPGQSKVVTITLSAHSLSYWDTAAQGWRKSGSKIGISVGASSRDFRLKGTLLAL